jgi:hypothetical protein
MLGTAEAGLSPSGAKERKRSIAKIIQSTITNLVNRYRRKKQQEDHALSLQAKKIFTEKITKPVKARGKSS